MPSCSRYRSPRKHEDMAEDMDADIDLDKEGNYYLKSFTC